ncbi:MAG: TIGR03663 family protein [Prosthecobacter sp.]|nr:TIGR03663 family protein [Prosthecobacter sp.]
MAARKEVTITLFSFLILAALGLGLGLFYRLPGLDLRPMHTDEAILGMKLAEYWQEGHFEYDPKDYHGPALHQVAMAWGRLAGWGAPDQWTDADLRMVVVLCGIGVMLCGFLFADAFGRHGAVLALLMTAVSPMMVYYSRYFIMEMQLVLLAALALGSFWRFSQGGGRLWLVLGGASLGFAHATKETFVLNIAAALAGWAVVRAFWGGFAPRKSSSSLSLSSPGGKKQQITAVWAWVLVPAVFVSVASYSNGFQDWKAVQDSLLTYSSYLERSSGSGHEKPWHYYLTLLVWRKDGLVWSEALMVVLGLVGMVHAVLGEHRSLPKQALLVFLSIYTLALTGIYSLIAYKTPWCILSAQHTLTLLAGVGAARLWALMQGRVGRLVFHGGYGLGIYFLCGQCKFVTHEYRADQRNPYAYSHTSTDLFRLVKEVRALAAERGEDFSAQVINRDSGWPLPWYWRTLPRVGYQTHVPTAVDAPLIIVDVDQLPVLKASLGAKAADYSESGPYGLRPGYYLSLLVKKTPLPEPKPTAPVLPPPQEPAPEAPPTPSPGATGLDSGSLSPVPGTLSSPPALLPDLPVLPSLPGAATPSAPGRP